METISYNTIFVNEFPFKKITKLYMEHKPNTHAIANIEGEIDYKTALDCIKRVDETTLISITTTAEQQPKTLFYGYVKDVSMSNDTEYTTISLSLCATSIKLDTKKINKTYQGTTKTYGAIIEENISSMGNLHMKVPDKPIGSLIMQYNETNWEFSKRMASQLNAPIISSLNAPKPQVYIGMPDSSKKHTIETNSYSYTSNPLDHERAKANGESAMLEDFSNASIKVFNYAYLGDEVKLNSKVYVVKAMEGKLFDGNLEISYALMPVSSSSNVTNLGGVKMPSTPNAASSGKMMLGTVKAVEKDKVQVHLTDIDKEYDGASDWWFPYSTAYSSSDGSGFYCMPEVEDQVRVFFPSGSEGDAFAASGVFAVPPENTRHKNFKAPGGKQILLTDEGIYIISKEGKIFINLVEEDGIEIYSESKIDIMAEGEVEIKSAKKVSIYAEEQVSIGAGKSIIDITKNSIKFAADNLRLN